jgi:adenine-specific DNA-methyltransferase
MSSPIPPLSFGPTQNGPEPEESAVKGFVPTPPQLVDAMVEKLFRTRRPRAGESLLDPGCGTGTFIHGVLRWCAQQRCPIPHIVGIDSDPVLLEEARRSLGSVEQVTLLHEEFLQQRQARFDYVVGNPPYVPITGLSVEERTRYRHGYRTAIGRFDLYLLFFEQALKLLKPEGRLVFVTPEKFLYVQAAAPLRRELTRVAVEEIELVAEATFGELVTYPTITTISASSPGGETRIVLRDGTSRNVRLGSESSWLPLMNGTSADSSGPRLPDAFVRISCGVATGADSVYVVSNAELPASLRRFAKPTLAGRRITPGDRIRSDHSMLIPYSASGALLPEVELGALGAFLRQPERRARLMQRTCVARKPWYAFHENPPLDEILRPKILCKDIGARPWFGVDESGDIVPRHSVYYLVPKDPARLHDLCAYLNSDTALEWLMAHCQRAANGFFRLQSHVLKRMPLPEELVTAEQLACV